MPLSKAFNKNNQTSKGDGTTNKKGDQGSQEGDPNSKNYIGGGSGDGIRHNLRGRSIASKPSIRDDSQDEGKVVVDIRVNQNGKVIAAEPGARGSTTTSKILYKKAKEAALNTRFNASPDAPQEQRGQMTFIFILN